MTKKIAYSYRRFSSKKQERGDSIRRQTAGYETLCAKMGWHTSTLSFEDLGVPSFKGQNLHKGKLGAFLDAVESGRIKKDSILVVESLDRISREEALDALDTIRLIIKSGVDIATTSPERIYTKQTLREAHGLFELLIHVMRANEESAIKSDRVAKVWRQKRKNAAKEKATARCPGWMNFDEASGEFILNKGAEAVRTIVTMCADGNGAPSIIKHLHKAKVSNPNTGKPKWSLAYVQLLMRDRRVIGEYQPCVMKEGKQVPEGPPIADYYPAVIDLQTFQRAQRAIKNRTRNSVGKQGSTINLFAGLIHDPLTDSKYICGKKAKGKAARLVPLAVRNHQAKGYSLDYEEVEEAVFGAIPFMQLHKMRDNTDAQQQEVNVTQARIKDITERITILKKRLTTDSTAGIEVIADAIRELAAEQERLSASIGEIAQEAAAKIRAIDVAEQVYNAMIEAEGEERTRLRLEMRQHLAHMIHRIDLVAMPVWRHTVGLMRVTLVTGLYMQRTTNAELLEKHGFDKIEMYELMKKHDVSKAATWPEEIKEQLGLVFAGHKRQAKKEPLKAKPKKKRRA